MTENRWLRSGFVWIILIIAVVALWITFISGGDDDPNIGVNQVAQEIKAGQVERLELTEGSNDVTVHYLGRDDTQKTRLDENISIYEALQLYGVQPSDVEIDIGASSSWGNWLGALTLFVPILLVVGIFIFMMRQAQGSNNQAMSFGKSRARLFTANKPTVTFA